MDELPILTIVNSQLYDYASTLQYAVQSDYQIEEIIVKRFKVLKKSWLKLKMNKDFDSIWKEYTDAHDELRKNSAQSVRSRWGEVSILNSRSPWKNYSNFDHETDFPNMLSGEEISYLSWLGSELIKKDDIVVEIGPWLGKSTRLLTYGKDFRRKILTIDDFIWRSIWMDPYVAIKQKPNNHESFLELFRSLNKDYLGYFEILQRRLNVYDGNEDVQALNSKDLPPQIDVLFVDCGRTIEVNEAWWQIIEPLLIPGESLIVMQDWRLWRESPQKHYNQTLFFTQSHSQNLRPIHEVEVGGLAAFLYV